MRGKTADVKVGCKTCVHWDRIPIRDGERDEGRGKCYCNPPDAVAHRPFPVTFFYERCPEWEER